MEMQSPSCILKKVNTVTLCELGTGPWAQNESLVATLILGLWNSELRTKQCPAPTATLHNHELINRFCFKATDFWISIASKRRTHDQYVMNTLSFLVVILFCLPSLPDNLKTSLFITSISPVIMLVMGADILDMWSPLDTLIGPWVRLKKDQSEPLSSTFNLKFRKWLKKLKWRD